jgi:hypothetical protein
LAKYPPGDEPPALSTTLQHTTQTAVTGRKKKEQPMGKPERPHATMEKGGKKEGKGRGKGGENECTSVNTSSESM